MDSALIPIGRFAALSRLTVRAVRHYDDLGLLRPRRVDPSTGYRYSKFETEIVWPIVE